MQIIAVLRSTLRADRSGSFIDNLSSYVPAYLPEELLSKWDRLRVYGPALNSAALFPR